jgi:hypothetical protein
MPPATRALATANSAREPLVDGASTTGNVLAGCDIQGSAVERRADR